jgi:hypothetical protein
MNDQMALMPAASRSPRAGTNPEAVSWDLDDHTREVGRLGLAAARQALRQGSARLAA